MKYADKLLDYRWILRRMEILERDNYECQRCFDSYDESILNVHHLLYLPNHEPWEYEDDALITLCQDCHKAVTIYGIPMEGIHNQWASYSEAKRNITVDLTPAEYDAEIHRLTDTIHV